MRNLTVVIVVFGIVLVFACRGVSYFPPHTFGSTELPNAVAAKVDPSPQSESISETEQQYLPTLERLKEFAAHGSGNPVDCGRAPRYPGSDQLAACGIDAFNQGKAFFLLYYASFEKRSVSNGIAGDIEGNVLEVGYDTKKWLKIAFPKRSQFSDEDRLVSTRCLGPISLIRTSNSELACAIPISPRASEPQTSSLPIETTISEILRDPFLFNNKIVRVRGRVLIGSEYSTIDDPGVDAPGIWFVLAGGSAPPGLVATVEGASRPGMEDADGRIIPPLSVQLVRNANFERFEQLMTIATKANALAFKSEKQHPVFHEVTATFIGRIDGVKPEIHAFQLKRTWKDKLDYLGFGQAGQFDAQLVVESVENDSVLESVNIP